MNYPCQDCDLDVGAIFNTETGVYYCHEHAYRCKYPSCDKVFFFGAENNSFGLLGIVNCPCCQEVALCEEHTPECKVCFCKGDYCRDCSLANTDGVCDGICDDCLENHLENCSNFPIKAPKK